MPIQHGPPVTTPQREADIRKALKQYDDSGVAFPTTMVYDLLAILDVERRKMKKLVDGLEKLQRTAIVLINEFWEDDGN